MKSLRLRFYQEIDRRNDTVMKRNFIYFKEGNVVPCILVPNTAYGVNHNSMVIITVFIQYESSLWTSNHSRIFCISILRFLWRKVSRAKYSRRHMKMTKTQWQFVSFKNEHKIQNQSRLLLLLAYNQYYFTFPAKICSYFRHCMVK